MADISKESNLTFCKHLRFWPKSHPKPDNSYQHYYCIPAAIHIIHPNVDIRVSLAIDIQCIQVFDHLPRQPNIVFWLIAMSANPKFHSIFLGPNPNPVLAFMIYDTFYMKLIEIRRCVISLVPKNS